MSPECPTVVLSLVVALGCVNHQATAAEFGWTAPPGCPEQNKVETRIAASLGEPMAQAGDFTFTATITHAEGEPWTLALVIAEPGTEGARHIRRFTAATCEELGDAAAAAVTFALTAQTPDGEPDSPDSAPDRAEEGPGSAEDGPSKRRRPPSSEPKSSVPPGPDEGADGNASPRNERARPFFFSAELGPVVDGGALPKASLGAALRAHLGYGVVSLRLGAFVLPEQRSTLDGSADEDAGGEFSLTAASASLCAGPSVAPGRVRLCAGAEGGRLTGRGAGVDFTSEAQGKWWALLADVSYEHAFGGSGLFGVAGAGAAAPLVRTRFTLREIGLAHEPSSLSWRGLLGVGWLFQ